jgi:hypothetical protein
MGPGKTSYQPGGVRSFPAVKDPFPRNEDIFEDHHGGFPLAEEGIAQFFNVISQFSLCGERGILADIRDPFRIRGGDESDGIICFVLGVG